MDHKHTQIGYLMLFILLSLASFYAWIYSVISPETGFHLATIAIMAFVLFILASFSTLTVKIYENYLWIRFGYGIFRKKFLIKDIISAKSTKNHWYYGWGIRFWLWPKMWIYNVSGFDAVEITMKNGRIYRIGTDEPKKLERAILQASKNR